MKEIYGEEIPVGEFKEEAEAEGISEYFVSDIFLKEELKNKGNLAWTDEKHFRAVNPKW